MRNTDEFSGCHPLVNFLYFALVLLFGMFFMHPVCLFISLVCSFVYAVYLRGSRAVRDGLRYMLPMLILAAVINPAFNHEGATILTYLPNGNPLTLESIYYGLAAAVMLVSIITWFTCFNSVVTSDKFIYLFGRIIPALSLVLSMTLRFIPKFRSQLHVVREAQKCIGRDASSGTVPQRVKNAVTILSIMTTWALENAVETADSMRSRGYGLPGRTAFSIYSFDGRDRALLIWLIFAGVYVVAGSAAGGLYFRYYPTVKAAPITPFTVSFLIAYLLLCLTPVILNAMEDRKWKRLRSAV
ncbi:MAG: energy-coupling factor transporter transmembrane protein EcfT [Oscillospiraceae bacterium]|nr:energy-coupling factor transporter transmembrane protein EcfT [Oscillospiraceae bacterium]